MLTASLTPLEPLCSAPPHSLKALECRGSVATTPLAAIELRSLSRSSMISDIFFLGLSLRKINRHQSVWNKCTYSNTTAPSTRNEHRIHKTEHQKFCHRLTQHIGVPRSFIPSWLLKRPDSPVGTPFSRLLDSKPWDSSSRLTRSTLSRFALYGYNYLVDHQYTIGETVWDEGNFHFHLIYWGSNPNCLF